MSREPVKGEGEGAVMFAALMPHAPILIPDVGGEELERVHATVLAMQRLCRCLVNRAPQALVLISPHSPRYHAAFGVWAGDTLGGHFGPFGAPDARVDLPADQALATEIRLRAHNFGLRTCDIHEQSLDHGALVPLWYISNAGWKGPTVVLGLNYPQEGGLDELGRSIAQAAKRLAKHIVVVASGDMSHRLSPDAPAGYDARAVRFDDRFIACLRRGDHRELERFDSNLVQLAAEDALDSTRVAAASVNWNSAGHEVLSYQGPFGVGYGVAVLFDSQAVQNTAATATPKEKAAGMSSDILPQVARESLKAALFETAEQPPPILNKDLSEPHGVFVTIRKPNGQLRGCMGTLSPQASNLVKETQRLSCVAAFHDARFPAITCDEYPDLRFEVTVVDPLEEVKSASKLDPSRYGVVLSTEDGRQGCLLPGIPGLETVGQQLQCARLKGRIGRRETVRIQRFRASKHQETNDRAPGGLMFTPIMQSSHEAGWWSVRPDGRIQCDLCPRRCKLQEGQRGFCFVRQRSNNRLRLTTYGRTSGFWVDPVEKKPLNHFYPGSGVLSFGTVGCNLGCQFCQNWDLSKARELDRSEEAGAPDKIARAAQELGCKAVAFTYNDPVVFAEYAIDVAQACHALDVQTIAVTAGYINAQPRAEFYHHMDAANVDLKGFTEDFYRKLCFAHLEPVLETLEYLHKQTDVWLEVTSLLIPGENDQDEQLHWAAEWFAEHLGPDVPWHFTGFHPDFKMLNKEPTPPATLAKARAIALSKGLRYVYTGNIRDPGGNSTCCPQCQEMVIQRDGYEVDGWNLNAGRCRFCGCTIAGRFDDTPGRWGPRRMPVELAEC